MRRGVQFLCALWIAAVGAALTSTRAAAPAFPPGWQAADKPSPKNEPRDGFTHSSSVRRGSVDSITPGNNTARQSLAPPHETKPSAAPPASHIYKTFGERKLQLAMHYPPVWNPEDKRPGVLFFSGAHKVQPDKNGKLPPLAAERAQLGLPVVNHGPGENHVPLCDALAKRGLVCLRVEYRTRGRDGVLPGEDIADAISAMRWVRSHAALLGIDPERVVAAGGSSGGYLAASLFAFEGQYPAAGDASVSARPNAILLYSPLVDWLDVGSMSESFLVVLNGDKELGAKISPARHWRKDCPPTLVMVGTEEPPFAAVQAFAGTWKANGAPMELFVAKGGQHGFFAQPAWVDKTLARTDEFLRANNLLLPEPSRPNMATASNTPPPASQVYKTVGERKLTLAIHYPPGWKSADQRPAIVFFGGGGFNPTKGEGTAPAKAGPGQAFAAEAEHFARLGLVGVRVEYRKRKTDGVLPDKAVEDAKSAMRWVRANAAQLGIDPNRIVSCGGSSGGHLAASVGVLEEFDAAGDDVRFSAKPNGMMLHFPLLDFLEGGTRTMPFLDALDGDKVLGERLSPARHWRKDLPPTLVLIGTKDPMFEFLKGFAARWQDAGADLALYIGEDGGHGFSTTDAWRERSLARMEEFLRKIGCFDK